ncbi:MAG TPA: hypothetical protein VGG99_19370 [Acetobacteraceae bacterium]
MDMIFNERTRLFATFLNNIAVATIVTSLIAPAVSYFYGVGNLAPNRWWLLIALAWFVLGVSLHRVAVFVLGSLRQ